jgi:hypothetical protein
VRQGSAGTTRPIAQLNLGPPDVKHAPTHPVFGRVNPSGPFASAFTGFRPQSARRLVLKSELHRSFSRGAAVAQQLLRTMRDMKTWFCDAYASSHTTAEGNRAK